MTKEKYLKGWNEIKINDSWAIFKIMGEFVNGFEKMSAIGPCVTIFGSARPKAKISRLWHYHRRGTRNYGSRE